MFFPPSSPTAAPVVVKPDTTASQSIFIRMAELPEKLSRSIGTSVLSQAAHLVQCNVAVNAPVIIIPESTVSSNAFVISLGFLSIKCDKECKSGLQPRDLNQICVQMSAVNISRYLFLLTSSYFLWLYASVYLLD